MKFIYSTLLAIMVAMCGFVTTEAKAATLLGDYLKESGIEADVSASIDFYNHYVWRGQILDNDGVIQPGIAATVGGFEIGIWGSYDMENEDGLASDEQDAWVAYSFALDSIGITVGHTWYDFPEGGTSSKEYFVSVSFDELPLAPAISVYSDYEDGDGEYYALDVGHSFTMNEEYGITLDLAATIGVYDGQWGFEDGVHITPSVSLTIPMSDNLTITPTVAFNRNLSGDIEASVPDETYVGVSVAYSS